MTLGRLWWGRRKERLGFRFLPRCNVSAPAQFHLGERVSKGRPAKKYSQAGRVHDVIRLIEARHGITIGELAEETGVDRRTIHRDLRAIHEAGYPLVSEWQEGGKA